jgi:hypothetical protein
MENLENSYLNDLIDYGSIKKIEVNKGGNGSETRIISKIFNSYEIITYKDLIQKSFRIIGSQNKNVFVKDEKWYKYAFYKGLKNFGSKKFNLVIEHLRKINFDFNEDYARRIVYNV